MSPDHAAPSAAPTRKVTAVGLGGAVATVATWIVGEAGIDVPATVAAAITTIAVSAAGYLTHD